MSQKLPVVTTMVRLGKIVKQINHMVTILKSQIGGVAAVAFVTYSPSFPQL